MRESRRRGGQEGRKLGPFVGRKQRRQSLRTDKMKKNKKNLRLRLYNTDGSMWRCVREKQGASQDIR